MRLLRQRWNMACSKTQKVIRGYSKMVVNCQGMDKKAAEKVALAVQSRIEELEKAGKSVAGNYHSLFENLCADFDVFADQKEGMINIKFLFEDMTSTSNPTLHGNIVWLFNDTIFDKTIVSQVAMREEFLRRWGALSKYARAKGIDGVDVIAQSINGRTNVKAVDYVTRVSDKLLENHTKLLKLEGSLDSVSQDLRGLDLIAREKIALNAGATPGLISGEGEFLTAELMSGDLKGGNQQKVRQGIKHIQELYNDSKEPGLFRFIHNTDQALVKDAQAAHATDFLEEIQRIANDTNAKEYKACKKVMDDLNGQVKGISSWVANEKLDVWVTGKGVTPIPARQKVADKAVETMQKWFYAHFRVEGYMK